MSKITYDGVTRCGTGCAHVATVGVKVINMNSVCVCWYCDRWVAVLWCKLTVGDSRYHIPASAMHSLPVRCQLR